MKRLISLTVCMLILLSLPLSVSAAYPPVMDSADLLSDDAYNALQEKCLFLRETYGIDVAICIADTIGGKSAQNYADDWYDAHNYSEHGVLFLLAMEEREWHISTCGDAIWMLTDADLMALEDAFFPYLVDGEYEAAFDVYLSRLPDYLETETPVDIYYDTDGKLYAEYESEESGISWILSILVGAVISGIVILIMRSSMNTNQPQRAATAYQGKDSYHLKTHQDLFLYSNVTKQAKPEQTTGGGGSSVHTSSSGRSHGGRGGKF